MKFLLGLLGAVIGAVSGMIFAVCGAVLGAGGNTLGIGFILVLLGPLGLLTGSIVGALVANRLRSRLTRSPSLSTRVRAWHVLRVLVTVLILDLSAVYAIVHADDPPPDRVLLANFERNEATFNSIVQMAQQDKGLTRVDDTWYADSKGSRSTYDVAAPPRIEEYRRLLRSIHTPRGISTDEKHHEITFLYWGIGSAISSDTTKGYVYTEKPPAPLLPTLDGYAPHRDPVRVYRRIRGNWYLFYEYLPG